MRILSVVGPRTLRSELESKVQRHPNRTWIIFESVDGSVVQVTFGDFQRRATQAAHVLSELGLAEHHRDDRMLAGQQSKAGRRHAGAEAAHVVEQAGTQVVTGLGQVDRLEPGDTLFFHCNTLHRSDQNRSDRRRWTFLCCYNAVSNDTYTKDDDRYYVPLDKVRDDAIKQAGLKFAKDNQEHFAIKAFVPEVKKAS